MNRAEKTKLAAECVRAAVEFDINDEYPPSRYEAMRLSQKAANTLRRIARDIMALPESTGISEKTDD